MSRGIISIYWGDKAALPLERLLASTQKFHPELPHEFIEIESRLDGAFQLQEKARMFDLSPFDETLYLDCDTVVLGRLDYGFNKALVADSGLALAICECPWARRYPKIFSGDEIEYNTGVVFFTRKAEPVFRQWQENASVLDSTIVCLDHNQEMRVMPSNDQGTFAAAIEQTGTVPFVLPHNWNYRPLFHTSFFGPVKIWHDYTDPPDDLVAANEYYTTPGHVIQFHC
ncbi:MAG: hypothetical protein HZA62_07860 [Rhodocyclales bacterium]|nr:hypothetical protein [Rhodocyclales bacterium]